MSLVRDQHSRNLVLSQTKRAEANQPPPFSLLSRLLMAAWLETPPVVGSAFLSARP